jgi:endo-1,4-beta-xylanase
MTLLHPKVADSPPWIWLTQLPPLLVSDGTWTNETLIAVMETHITNVVTHFKGLCYSWDVVNEAIDDYPKPGYRESIFYTTIGKAYISLAFAAAAAADKNAKLYYNDYNLEVVPAKADAAVKIITDVQARGIKIDGVGLQGHQVVGATPNRTVLADTLRKFAALGLEVAWSEIEIRHSALPPSAAALQQQARDYAAMVGACLDVLECVGVTVWQPTDKYNWVAQSYTTEGDACLWSKDYERRPAYDGIVEVLRAAIANGTRPAKTPLAERPAAKSAAGRVSIGAVGGFLGAALSAWLLL